MCDDLNNVKLDKLANNIFNLCDSGIHLVDESSLTFVKRCIAYSIYDMGPRIYSGKISLAAKTKLQAGEIKREKLCDEHPISRTKTAVDIITNFSYNKPNPILLMEIRKKLEKGSKVNIVLSEENHRLSKYQKDYSLSEEEIYEKAGVILVDDYVGPKYTYIYDNQEFTSKESLANHIGISSNTLNKRMKKDLIKVEIRENGN